MRKKQPRWRPRLCECSLYTTSHTIRSRKAWRKHQVQVAKLLAGARDAQPSPAHTNYQPESADSNLDINSSIATDPYGGADYQSLQGDEISHGGQFLASGHSADDLRTTSSLERMQRQEISPSFPTLSLSGEESVTSSSGIQQSTNSESSSDFVQQKALTENSGFANSLPASLESVFSMTGSESPTSVSSEFGHDSTTQRRSHRYTNYLAEMRFLEEVENLIGNPDDWTSSEDESMVGDPFEVGLMKRGFINEDMLEEDNNPDLLNLEDAVADLGIASRGGAGRREDTEPLFLYENQKGKPCWRFTRFH